MSNINEEFILRPVFNNEIDNNQKRKKNRNHRSQLHNLNFPPIVHNLINEHIPEENTSDQLQTTQSKTSGFIEFIRENKIPILISLIIILSIICLVIWFYSKDKKTPEANKKPPLPSKNQEINKLPDSQPQSTNTELKIPLQKKTDTHEKILETIDDKELKEYMHPIEEDKKQSKDLDNKRSPILKKVSFKNDVEEYGNQSIKDTEYNNNITQNYTNNTNNINEKDDTNKQNIEKKIVSNTATQNDNNDEIFEDSDDLDNN